MQQRADDPRNGEDLSLIQDKNGTDLLLLKEHLALSAEERLLRLQSQQEFVAELLGAAQSR